MRVVVGEQLRQLVKNVKLDDLFDELLPGEKVMKAIDASLSGGAEHVSVSIDDLVELFFQLVYLEVDHLILYEFTSSIIRAILCRLILSCSRFRCVNLGGFGQFHLSLSGIL